MFTYKNILNDNEIKQIYAKIEEETNYVVAHGIIHVENVLKLCKNIAKELKLPKEKTRLLLIACALHDIGRYIDNKTHNFTSAKFAYKYLQNKLTTNEINIVCDAIKYHSMHCAEWNKMDDIAHCLILADKLDLQKSRLLPELMHKTMDFHFDIYKFCNKTYILINDNKLILCFESNNPKLKSIILNANKINAHVVFENFVKHFNLLSYEFNFPGIE